MSTDHLLATTCEPLVTALTATLAEEGYRVERSFDLRAALHAQPACACPRHGARPCTCQYLVLLIYEAAAAGPPSVITAHESDGLTRLHVEAGSPALQRSISFGLEQMDDLRADGFI